jgi:hypothetical protein
MRGSATSAQVVGIYQTGEASFIVAVSNRVFLNSEHGTARGETVDQQLDHSRVSGVVSAVRRLAVVCVQRIERVWCLLLNLWLVFGVAAGGNPGW